MYSIHSILGIIAGIVASSFYFFYIYSIFKGKSKPEKMTWFSLALIGGAILVSYYLSGARDSIWLPVSEFVGCSIVAVLSLKYGEIESKFVDEICFLGIILGFFVWALSHDPLLALVVFILVDFLAVIPTTEKIYHEPNTESYIAWALAFIASFINIFAVEHFNFNLLIYPVYVFFIDGVIILLLSRKRGLFSSETTMNDPIIATWDEWDPKAYLQEYYSGEVVPDELETIAFLAKTANQFPLGKRILEFGCGPTIHHITPFIPHIEEVYMSDYLQSNLDELQKWLENKSDAHNWDKHVSYILRCEGIKNPSERDIESRKQEVRKKITKCLLGDASKSDPMGKEYRGAFSTVVSCYCADSAGDNHKMFELFSRNIASLIQPGGLFVFASLRKAKYYKSGEKYFPSANIDEDFLFKMLELDFVRGSIKIEVRNLPSHEERYSSTLLATAIKK